MNIDYTTTNIIVIIALVLSIIALLRRLDTVSRRAEWYERKLHQSTLWAEKLHGEHTKMIEANKELNRRLTEAEFQNAQLRSELEQLTPTARTTVQGV